MNFTVASESLRVLLMERGERAREQRMESEGSRDVEVLKNAALQAMALEYRGKLRRSL